MKSKLKWKKSVAIDMNALCVLDVGITLMLRMQTWNGMSDDSCAL